MPPADSMAKFKRNLDVVPYVEPTITNFLEKEQSRLRRESQTIVFQGDARSSAFQSRTKLSGDLYSPPGHGSSRKNLVGMTLHRD